jgi:hypothetical protein
LLLALVLGVDLAPEVTLADGDSVPVSVPEVVPVPVPVPVSVPEVVPVPEVLGVPDVVVGGFG